LEKLFWGFYGDDVGQASEVCGKRFLLLKFNGTELEMD
jgi:hypothetical protein